MIYFGLCFSLQNDRIMKMLILTKAFTWDSLPTRYADTGSRTNAGMISLMLYVVPRFSILFTTLHCCNFVIRALTGIKYPLFFNAWLPIEVNEFPGYLIILSIQVILIWIINSLFYYLYFSLTPFFILETEYGIRTYFIIHCLV